MVSQFGEELEYPKMLCQIIYMRRLLTVLLLLLTVALAIPTENVLIGEVVKVTDGDTITILTTDNLQERGRLWGIDAA